MIKQVWTPYWLWEDYINGMWSKVDFDLQTVIEFTGDHLIYGAAMKEVIYKWPNTMLNSLTNPSINKRAFVGHCAVNYTIGAPEYVTRMAWRELADHQRFLADKVAQETIDEWKNNYSNILKHGKSDVIQMGYQMNLQ